MDVNGKTAIVTGGAQGFGYAFTEALLQRGANVVICDVDTTLGLDVMNNFNKTFGLARVQFIHCDVSKREQLLNLFEKTKTIYGNIDIVVNNAGIGSESAMELMVQINLVGVIYGTELAIQYMNKDHGGRGGLIINIGSTAGLTVVPFEANYSATKAGVVAYTRAMASRTDETTDHGIRVVCLCPSFTATRLIGFVDKVKESGLTKDHNDLDEVAQHAQLVEGIGIMKISRVVESFLKLVDDPANNGGVLAVSPKSMFYRYPKGMTGKL